MQLVAQLVRNKKVSEALDILQFTPKVAAKYLLKVINSAASNAKNNDGADIATLVVSQILVGRGPKLKRVRFASRSRIAPYVKHRSFVKVILDTK
jgi:large subunit ribosomal protein L22